MASNFLYALEFHQKYDSGYGDAMSTSFAEKVRAVMAHNNWTQQKAADEFGVTQPTIFRWLRGTSPEGHHRDAVNEAYRQLPGQTEVQSSPNTANTTVGISVVGKIRAGNWLDTTLVDDCPNDPEIIPVARDPRFPHAEQYALEVQGDSMDKEFPDGSFVICVDFFNSGLAMKDEMIVHVERWRHGLREVTLKVLMRDGERWKLEPRSNNPSHQPIFMNGHTEDGTEIFVRGVVIGEYRRRKV